MPAAALRGAGAQYWRAVILRRTILLQGKWAVVRGGGPYGRGGRWAVVVVATVAMVAVVVAVVVTEPRPAVPVDVRWWSGRSRARQRWRQCGGL